MDFYTIGHSTHTMEEFISILKQYDIKVLVDIRSYPGSNYVPQFNKESMEQWVPEYEIKYTHIPNLGGRRNKMKDIDESLINGWEKASFRNYAAYSLTTEYEQAIERMISLGETGCVCYMCAEVVPWRCHRLIVSNTLVSKGNHVYHIMSGTKTIEHEVGIYGAKAVMEGSRLIYPKDVQDYK